MSEIDRLAILVQENALAAKDKKAVWKEDVLVGDLWREILRLRAELEKARGA